MATRAAIKIPEKAGGRFFLFKGVAIILVLMTGWLLINIDNLQEFLETYYRRNQEVEEIDALKLRIRTLRKEQHSLMYNGIAREREVRVRLHMHKPGEKVIFLTPEGSTSSSAEATPGIEEPDDNAGESTGEVVLNQQSAGSGQKPSTRVKKIRAKQ